MTDQRSRPSIQIADPDGRIWTLRRRRLDKRTVRSMLRHSEIPVLLSEAGGAILRWLPDDKRAGFAEEVYRCYGLPLNSSSSAIQYVGREFLDVDGRRMLHLETRC